MKIVATFVPYLYAFQFPNEDLDELERVFDDWNNPSYLLDFFTQYKSDLKGSHSVEEAVIKTKIEAQKFYKKMLLLAEKNPHQLNEFFANLYNNEYKTISLQRQKAKQNWLRLYALKITQVDMQDIYVITGGIIKLTQNMEDRKHGDFERNKINQSRDYLKSIGVYEKNKNMTNFLKHVSIEDSGWMAKAKWRQENEDWLDVSFDIAIRIGSTLYDNKQKNKYPKNQVELAEAMGCSAQYINKLLKGQENLQIETICKIGRILGLSLIEVPKIEVKQVLQLTNH